ncbi:hypothetical protein CIK06_15280 [Plantactinospora sp. KBS50]|nr:hypothetical protein CIK06_15280 [Plantactinospora sp. KBS50]
MPPGRRPDVGPDVVPPGRFRRRLTVAFVLVAGVAAAVLAVGAYLLVQRARLDDSLDQAATDLRYQLVIAGQFLPLDGEHGAELLESFEGSGRHVLLATGTGPTATNPAASNPAVAPPLGTRLRALVGTGQLGYERSGDRLVVGGRIPGSTAQLYVVHSEQRIRRDLAQLRYALLAGWLAVLLLAGAVGNALARRTLEPVARAGRAARAIAEGLLSTRLPVTGRDEFGAWALSFNGMAEALERQMSALAAAQRRERRFTADVAHELRTPVTALVGAAALLHEALDGLPEELRRPAQLLVGDTVRLRRLVEDLMEISRLDAGRESLAAEPVDLRAAVTSLVAARGWTDRVRVRGPHTVRRTDPRRLERVLANLIANAVEHGGRTVEVTIDGAGPGAVIDGAGPGAVADRTSRGGAGPGAVADRTSRGGAGPGAVADRTSRGGTGPGATVTVADDGPGIPAEHLPHLFDRFYKADSARTGPGSGLGLAIARENARLLGATLTLESRPGTGTRARMVLPANPPAAHATDPTAPGGPSPGRTGVAACDD